MRSSIPKIHWGAVYLIEPLVAKRAADCSTFSCWKRSWSKSSDSHQIVPIDCLSPEGIYST